MTVAENMAFSLTLAGAPAAEKKARVAEAAQILGLTELLARMPRQLSGGQRQRVAMGRSIVRQPKVFLFDEPLSNLDAKLRVAMRAEIKSLHRRLTTTIVYVTHDQIEAMTMADRIVVMNGGGVEQIGKPLDLFDNPQSLFVATFIGSPSMNILEGRFEPEGFRHSSGTLLPLPAGVVAPEGGVGHYGIRPEHLRLADEGPIAVRVSVVEPLGSETLITARIEGTSLVVLLRDRRPVEVDDTIHLAPDLAHVHLFGDGGRRL